MHAATPGFAPGGEMGGVNTYNVWEASGFVVSRQNPDVLWTHNDSGYRGSIFALTTNGAWLAQYKIPGISSGNFEDIAFGPGPFPHSQYLYLGDIGDNFLTRETTRVLRVRVHHSDTLPLWETNRFLILTNGVGSFTEAATNLFRVYRLAH